MSEVLGLIAGFLALFAFIPYILSILGRDLFLRPVAIRTRPSRTTWFIWTFVGVMLAASYYESGATYTLWVPVALVIGPFITAVLSIWYGEGGWRPLDIVCFSGAALSGVLWWWFESPEIALYMNITMDFFGIVPTIKKSYFEPQHEDTLAWTITLLGGIANIAAVSWFDTSFAVAAYPLYMLFIDSVIVALLYRPYFFRRAVED